MAHLIGEESKYIFSQIFIGDEIRIRTRWKRFGHLSRPRSEDGQEVICGDTPNEGCDGFKRKVYHSSTGHLKGQLA